MRLTRSTGLRLVLLCAGALSIAPFAHAGQSTAASPEGASGLPTAFDGPPPPVAPETISRDAAGRATLRAVRLAAPLKIDGRLDEEVYQTVPPMSGFIQNDPKEGAPASEETDLWILFDDDNLYFVARCWHKDVTKIVATEMRRDHGAIVQNDNISWSFDTFYDRRNMLFFEVGASGGRIDGQVTDERQVSLDWNPIWEAKAATFNGGYIVEASMPFKSLRYKPGSAQLWGFQARRRVAANNEFSYLTPIPAQLTGQGHFRAALAATLVGIEAPPRGLNLDLKPFVTSHMTTDRTVSPILTNDPGGAIGLDAKYAVTQGLAADLTVNTDFAQVEADEQQVNLTRFSLFFPEKRDFFLENGGIFNFGATQGAFAGVTEAPLLFYSRNIGLVNSSVVPIRAGGRLSGRTGPWTLGVLNVQSGADEALGAAADNFSVVRVKRDVLRRGNIGVMFTNRAIAQTAQTPTQSYGADGSYSFGPDLAINAYLAKTHVGNIRSDDRSYRGLLDYTGDRYGAQVEHLKVGLGFRPDVGLGFARRFDFRKNLLMLRFSPRPKQSAIVRKYVYSGTFTSISSLTTGRLETRLGNAHFETQFQNSDSFSVDYNYEYQFLPAPFSIARDIKLPVQGYAFGSAKGRYSFGQQRSYSGALSLEHGAFYSGDKTTFTVTTGRLNFPPRFTVEPGVTINTVTLKEGAFTQRLLTSRFTYSVTPLMFTSALLQYNKSTNTVAANVRFRWEYQPGSELFIVYNEQRDSLVTGFPNLTNRALIVKINRVFRF